jgi:ABC-type transport system involved in cytochrome c biogenesis permease component
MTALFFALFVVSFAAPAVTAVLVGLTARTKNGGYVALTVSMTVIIFAMTALHWAVYDQHPSWSGNGVVLAPYILVSFVGSAVAVAMASDFIDKKG